jgi:hypothetical protein
VIDARIEIPGAIVRRVRSLPAALEGAVRVGPYSSARPGALLRVVPGVGRFLARDGTSLDYWTEPGADAAAAEALLQGGVLGALIHQRGELPLHATTLLSPDRTFAVALAGHSGAGKSTTAYALVRRGWIMLSDDLTRITLDDGAARAWPGRSRLRLLADACEGFGIDPATLAAVPNWPGKYQLDLPRWNEPAPLAAIVVLERSEGPFRLDLLRGAGALRALAEQTYRPHYVRALGRAGPHFELVAATATKAVLLRAHGRAPVGKVAALIASRLAKH